MVMKKMLVFLLSTLLVVSLCACGAGGANGSGGATAGTSSETAVETGGEDDQILVSDPIDFTLDEGNVKYVGFEKADPNLTDEENALVFVFEFTNYQDKPAAVQEKFWISFFQNGAELSKSVSYSGEAREQFELVGSFHDTAMKGGTVTFGRIVVPEDNSPITIMVNKQGDSDTYQLSEVVIDPASGGSVQESNTGDTMTSADNKEVYADVVDAISEDTWVFNGGGDTVLDYMNFKDDKAIIGQVYFDGNGLHDNGENECEYVISDDSITIMTNTEELEIPYSFAKEDIRLGSGEYFTLAQVKEAIQGCWKYSYYSFGKQEGYLQIDQSTLKSEKATEASGGSSGEYYYYGPYDGSYTLGIGCFETEMRHGHTWFYNIIEGTPTIFNYEQKCTAADGLPGEKGYSF